MDIYSVQRDWNSAQKLLRDFKHYGALPKQGAAAVEIEVYSGLFTDFVASSDLNKTEQYNQLAELWELVPKALRKTPELVAPFADALAQIEATDKLLPLLSKTLNNHWHPDLIERFGTLPIATPEKQLAMAEKWLPSHSEDADLLLALGRICRRLEFMGKARDYLSTAITIDPRPQIYLELAQVLDILGEPDASADMYRQGLEARLVDC
jgi:HemY protein